MGASLLPLIFIGISPGTVDGLAFLTGGWVTDSRGARIEEHWISPEGGTMFGLSRTIASGETVAFEFLRIETREDGIVYVAKPNGRSPTDFRLTHLSDGTATFENPEHDHPKVIRYQRSPDGTLLVTIEGDEKGEHVRQEFRFRPLP